MSTAPTEDRTEDRMERLLAVIDSDSSTEGEKENAQRFLQILQRKSSVSVEELRQRSRKKERIAPEIRYFTMGKKGDRASGAFSLLFDAIAYPNDVKCLLNDSEVEAVGMAADLDYTHALYERLAVQMVLSCQSYIKSGEWKSRESKVNLARRAFYLGYTNAIRDRLIQANALADREIARESGVSSSVALRDKKERISETYSEHKGTRSYAKFGDNWKAYRTPSMNSGKFEGNRARMFDNQEFGSASGEITR